MEKKIIPYGTERKVTVVNSSDKLITVVDENNEAYLLLYHGMGVLPKKGAAGKIIFTYANNPAKGYWKFEN